MGGMSGMGSGMGGMGGTRSRGASMFNDDDDMGPFTSSGGMPGGMPGSRPGSGHRSPRTPAQSTQPSEISKPLPISLDDLYQGATKRMKVSRKLLGGGTEEKVSHFTFSKRFTKGFDPNMSGGRFWRLTCFQAGNPEQKSASLEQETNNPWGNHKTSSSLLKRSPT